MDTAASGPDLRDYAALLRRRWRVVAAGVLAGLVIAGIALALAPATYTATTAVQVRPTGLADITGEKSGRTNGEVNLDTEAQVVRSATVAGAAADLLGTRESPTDLRERVDVTVPPNSSVLRISYAAASPESARAGSEAFADAYLKHRRDRVREQIDARLEALRDEAGVLSDQLEDLATATAKEDGAKKLRAETRLEAVQNEITDLSNEINPLSALRSSVAPGEVLTAATAPESATAPVPLVWLGSGALLGLMGGLALAYRADRTDGRLRTAGDVRRASGAPVLLDLSDPAAGTARDDGDGSAASAVLPLSGRPAEHVNEVAHTLSARLGAGGKVLLVPGVSPGRSGMVAAANLAAALSRIGADTLLVCADPDGAAASELLDLPAGPGLAEVLNEGADPAELETHPTGLPELRVLRHGVGDAAPMVQREGMRALIRRLAGAARYVVVAAAPTSERADAHAMAAAADAVLPAVELGGTRGADLTAALSRLDALGAEVPGTVAVPAPPGPARPRSARPDSPAGEEEPAASEPAEGQEAGADLSLQR